MKKHFIVQVQPGERTRFLCDDKQLCESLAQMARAIFDTWTTGPRANIAVMLVERDELDGPLAALLEALKKE